MLRVWGLQGQVPLHDRQSDPVSVHADSCLLGCRDWEALEDVVCKTADKHPTVIAIRLSGGLSVTFNDVPIVGERGAKEGLMGILEILQCGHKVVGAWGAIGVIVTNRVCEEIHIALC